MEPICGMGERRSFRWMLACLAGAFSFAAALAHLAYVGNGIAAGAIIGLPGREGDVTAAQHHAVVWLGISALFQFGVVIALFWLLRFGAEADRLVRFVLAVLLRRFFHS